MVHQGREAPLRSVDVKSRSNAYTEIVPYGPHQPWMYGKGAPARRVLLSWNQFEIVCHAPFALEGYAN